MKNGVHDPLPLGQSKAGQPVDTMRLKFYADKIPARPLRLGVNPHPDGSTEHMLWFGRRLDQIARKDNRSAIDEECDRILAGEGHIDDLLKAAHDTTVDGKDRAESLIVLLWNALLEIRALAEERQEQAGPQPVAAIVPLTERPTAESILLAMGTIMTALTNGSMSAADAKARLYAHQIALSAMRTIDTAEARKKKEARLRRTAAASSPRRKPAPATSSRHASPKPKARGKHHAPRKSKPKRTRGSIGESN